MQNVVPLKYFKNIFDRNKVHLAFNTPTEVKYFTNASVNNPYPKSNLSSFQLQNISAVDNVDKIFEYLHQYDNSH